MVKVLSTNLFPYDINTFFKEVKSEVEKKVKNNYCISATGAHGIITAKKDKSFKEILNSFYINLPDGMPGVWVGRMKGAKEMDRCYGPDVFKYLITETASLKINHYFCGGKPGVAEELKGFCERDFKNANIVGFYSPPFREMRDEELKDLADNINNKQTDIVWIGLSTPKQELFAYKLSKYTNVHFIITVGAAFDFYTGKVKQAPRYIQKAGLEWLFRLLMEPRRLWKRYFEIVPLFILYNLAEIIKGNFFKSENNKENING